MIQLAQYRGKSKVSRAIRMLTYSIYSHTAIRFVNDLHVETEGREYFVRAGSVIEAWTGGVRMVSSLDAQHTPGTGVDLYELRTPLSLEQEQRLAAFLLTQVGKPYDYLNVLRFVPIVHALFPKPAPEIWNRQHVFCSELAFRAFLQLQILLLERIAAWKVFPGLLSYSPLLKHTDTHITT